MADSPFPPQCARKFRAGKLLASGGFGAVYEATQIALDRPVVVKLLHAQVLADPTEVRRFLDEARITAALTSPHIVVILDHDAREGMPWIAYERVPGRSVRTLLVDGPLPIGLAALIVSQVCAALEVAHDKGIFHRDIKPENVLEARRGLYKVADFGIAKWAAAGSVKTLAGLVMGTPAYIAPELIEGQPASAHSDLYAAGIMLHELLTGDLPFYDDNPVLLLERHLKSTPPRPSARNGLVPPALDRIVAQVLAKRPDARPHSAGALRALLLPFAESSSPEASGEVQDAVASVRNPPAPTMRRPDPGPRRPPQAPPARHPRASEDAQTTARLADPRGGRQGSADARGAPATQQRGPNPAPAASARSPARAVASATAMLLALAFVVLGVARQRAPTEPRNGGAHRGGGGSGSPVAAPVSVAPGGAPAGPVLHSTVIVSSESLHAQETRIHHQWAALVRLSAEYTRVGGSRDAARVLCEVLVHCAEPAILIDAADHLAGVLVKTPSLQTYVTALLRYGDPSLLAQAATDSSDPQAGRTIVPSTRAQDPLLAMAATLAADNRRVDQALPLDQEVVARHPEDRAALQSFLKAFREVLEHGRASSAPFAAALEQRLKIVQAFMVQQPDDADANVCLMLGLLRRSQFLSLSDRCEVATRILQIYERLHPAEVTDPFVHGTAARALVVLNRDKEVVEAYARITGTPLDGYGEESYAESLTRIGRSSEAIGHFQRALEVGFSPAWCHYNLGKAYLAQGDTPKARVELAAAVATDDGRRLWRFHVALAMARPDHDCEKALAELTEWLDPAQTGSDAIDAPMFAALAQRQWQCGTDAQARRTLDRARAAFERDGDGVARISRALAKGPHLDALIDWTRRWCTLDPSQWEPCRLEADALHALHRDAEEIPVRRREAEMRPTIGAPEFQNVYRALVSRGDWTAAGDLARQALPINAVVDGAPVEVAMGLMRGAKDGMSALAVLDRAIAKQMHPGHPVPDAIVIARADCLASLGRFQDARASIQPYVITHPDDEDALAILGNCLCHLDRSHDLLALCRRWRAHHPAGPKTDLLVDCLCNLWGHTKEGAQDCALSASLRARPAPSPSPGTR